MKLWEGEDEGDVLDEDGVDILLSRNAENDDRVDVVDHMWPFHDEGFLLLLGC